MFDRVSSQGTTRLVLLLAAACTGTSRAKVVDGAWLLPRVLREVSAIASVDERTVVCLQDEAAALYRFDLVTGGIAPTESFGVPGDYEGLAAVGSDWWALRAEGVLVHVRDVGSRLHVAAEHRLPGGHSDWEGLCWDAERGQLLAMPKVRLRDHGSDQRPIYAFDPQHGKGAEEPFLVFSRRALVEQCRKLGLIGADAELEIASSDLVVLPGRRELLLLSAVDAVLLRVGFDGVLLGGVRLDRKQLPKPEGITLLPDGALLIASEGRGAGGGCLRRVPVP